MIVNKQLASSEFKETDLWETPDYIFDALNDKFYFTLDPCATKENAKCKYFFTEKENGLKQSWNGAIIFCNPPYSRGNIDLWVKKCFDNRRHQTVVALLPVSTSADWFQKYCIGQTLLFVDKRIRFIGAKYTAPFSSVIVHFNDENKVGSFKQSNRITGSKSE
jgi:phage N-6-adenine-methyltransferase